MPARDFRPPESAADPEQPRPGRSVSTSATCARSHARCGRSPACGAPGHHRRNNDSHTLPCACRRRGRNSIDMTFSFTSQRNGLTGPVGRRQLPYWSSPSGPCGIRLNAHSAYVVWRNPNGRAAVARSPEWPKGSATTERLQPVQDALKLVVSGGMISPGESHKFRRSGRLTEILAAKTKPKTS